MLISLLVIVIVLAIVFWVLRQIPFPAPFGWIAYAVVGLIAIIALLNFIGLGTGLGLHSLR